jgi:hypothetical protein
MTRKRHKPEEIVAKLRQVDVLVSQGQAVADAIRAIGVTEVAPRRAARRRDLLLTPGGAGDHRELEKALHSSAARLARIPPAPEVFVPAFAAWPAAQPQPAAPAKLPVEQRPTMH